MELSIENLTKVYGSKKAVNIPSLHIRSGEIVGLVGNNGAGKSTLLRLILDLIKADSGRVLSDGVDVTGAADGSLADFNSVDNLAWKHYTGSFIDGRFLIDFYTPEEYFHFIGRLYGLSEESVDARLQNFAPLMHDEILGTNKYIRNFSEGNRQKIGIIGAMLIQPKVLLLDEPFNYLDPSSQITVARLIQENNRAFGTTTIISSHNLSFVSDISSRILLLEKGEVIKDLPNADGSAIAQLEDYFQTES